MKPKTLTPSGHWSIPMVKHFHEQMMKGITPGGWALLTVRLRKAVVAEFAFGIIRGQDRDSVPMVAIDELYNAMLEMAGLE